MLRPIRDIAFDRIGKRPSQATQWRWLHKGIRGVKLNAQYVNGRWMTTAADFDAFTQRQTTQRLAPDTAEIDRQLRAAGLL